MDLFKHFRPLDKPAAISIEMDFSFYYILKAILFNIVVLLQ